MFLNNPKIIGPFYKCEGGVSGTDAQTNVKNTKQETRNKTVKHIRGLLVCITAKQKTIVSRNVVSVIKQCLIRETCFHQNMCEKANQQSISSYVVVYMVSNKRFR